MEEINETPKPKALAKKSKPKAKSVVQKQKLAAKKSSY